MARESLPVRTAIVAASWQRIVLTRVAVLRGLIRLSEEIQPCSGWEKMMKRENITALVFALLACMCTLVVDAQTKERTGYAYKLGSEKLLYTEEHEELSRDGAIQRDTVTYRGAEGRVIATKNLDFSVNPTSPDFRMENSVNGHVEGARQEGKYCVVFFRKTSGDEYREKKIELPDRAIIDGGFDRFIELNWSRLLAGEVFKRPFLVPSFHKFVDFRIYLEKSTDANVVFAMEPASFLLRLVADKIIVTYERDNAALRRYEGISNIRDQDGENFDVRVEFPEGGNDTKKTAAAMPRGN